MSGLLRILVGLTGVLAVIALPFAAAVITAGGVMVEDGAAMPRQAGLWVLAAFPPVALVLAVLAWRAGRSGEARRGFLWLSGAPVWAMAGAGLLLLAQAMAPPQAAAPRAPDDLRELAAFLAREDAPTILDLSGRGLRRIPPEALAAHRLIEIDMRGNALTTLPDALLEMPALRVLRIGGNPLPPEEVRRFGLRLLAADHRLVLIN